jgi:hypothetical protein
VRVPCDGMWEIGNLTSFSLLLSSSSSSSLALKFLAPPVDTALELLVALVAQHSDFEDMQPITGTHKAISGISRIVYAGSLQ